MQKKARTEPSSEQAFSEHQLSFRKPSMCQSPAPCCAPETFCLFQASQARARACGEQAPLSKRF